MYRTVKERCILFSASPLKLKLQRADQVQPALCRHSAKTKTVITVLLFIFTLVLQKAANGISV